MKQNRNLSGIIETIQDDGPSPSLTGGAPERDSAVPAGNRARDDRQAPAARHGFIRWLSFVLLVTAIISGTAGVAWQFLLGPSERDLVKNSISNVWPTVATRTEEAVISPQVVTLNQAPGAASPEQELHTTQAQIISRLDELAAAMVDESNRNTARWVENDIKIKELQESQRQGLNALTARVATLWERPGKQGAVAAPARVQPASAVQEKIGTEPAVDDAGWVVNVASSTQEKPIRDMMGDLQLLGIAAVLNTATVNDTTRYRLQVPGFATSGEARRYADRLASEYGIKDAWPSRK